MTHWDQTDGGQQVNGRWEYLRGVMNSRAPSHLGRLENYRARRMGARVPVKRTPDAHSAPERASPPRPAHGRPHTRAPGNPHEPRHTGAPGGGGGGSGGGGDGGGGAAGSAGGTDWRRDVLADLGITPTDTNLLALALWARAEGMPPSENNPLATTLRGPRSRTVNSSGVQSYATAAEGAHAIASTLLGGAYGGVRTALRVGSLHDIWAAVNASPWCAGCQGGGYPDTML